MTNQHEVKERIADEMCKCGHERYLHNKFGDCICFCPGFSPKEKEND